MGFDASVRCNCWEQGLTKPWRLGGIIHLEDGYLTLTSSEPSLLNAFYEWEESCCPHPRMTACSEHLANLHGYWEFRRALLYTGDASVYPVLSSELPSGNSGFTPATQVPAMLTELTHFEASTTSRQLNMLIDSETGAVLYTTLDQSRFLLNRNLHISIDDQGIAFQTPAGEVVFRAQRLRQTKLPPTTSGPTGNTPNPLTLYTDLDRGDGFVCELAISSHQIPWPDGTWKDGAGQARWHYPSELHWEQRPFQAADYRYIVEPLRVLCATALETGNPIRWE